ncbi:hypothetical protein ASPSYDRAFT_52391, partial [Aspergillus sydowii CBS 593.65]
VRHKALCAYFVDSSITRVINLSAGGVDYNTILRKIVISLPSLSAYPSPWLICWASAYANA